MNLFVHELSHIALSIVPAMIIIKIFKLKKTGDRLSVFAIGLIGGFLIDLDHLIDYFSAFGLSFNLQYFIKGYQFLKSDKIFIFFHSYELIILFLLITILLRRKFLLISILSLLLVATMLLHITFDAVENELPPQTYSFTYRLVNNFDLKKLVYPDNYRYHLEQKKKVKFK